MARSNKYILLPLLAGFFVMGFGLAATSAMPFVSTPVAFLAVSRRAWVDLVKLACDI